MAERNERVVLNELIVTCRDSARGFEWAAEHADDPGLRALCLKVASKRHEYVMELLPHVEWLGGAAHEGEGSKMATLHRGWMAVKDRLAPRHDHAIVVEAERGERAALVAYFHALNSGLPAESQRVIETQNAGVRAARESLHALATTV
jgi:uncharacterized protein (TIGR02284 family)